MRQLSMATLMAISLGACAASNDEVDPATSEVESSITEIFRETWNNLIPGKLNGQNGWGGNCMVVGAPSGYLRCLSGTGASKYIGSHGAGSYTLLADMSPNINVVNATHGKLSLEGPDGRVFQIIIGCDNIRVAFEMSGPTAVLATFPCQSLTGPPKYRVVCDWSTSGTVLSCGASRLPLDPTNPVSLVVPGPLRPFDTAAITTFALPGASLFDKIYIWRN